MQARLDLINSIQFDESDLMGRGMELLGRQIEFILSGDRNAYRKVQEEARRIFGELENFDLTSDLEIARAGLEGLGVEGLSEELDNDNSSEINEDQILQDLAQNLAASQIEESELPENLPTSETLDSEESEEPAE